MVKALLQDYREGGWMPKWPNPSYTNIMIGTHADSLVAEAIAKGFKGFDRKLAYAAVRRTPPCRPKATPRGAGSIASRARRTRRAPGSAMPSKLGYIPADKVAEAASSTLEEAYDDYAVAQVAKATGACSRTPRASSQRSLDYRKLFNPARGFMQARNADGSWASPDEGWTEGDQWVYLFAALHDIPGTVALLGGAGGGAGEAGRAFCRRPQPSRQRAQPSLRLSVRLRAARRGRPRRGSVSIAATAYSDTPTGILGNEDCGQMSAWYVFTAMGFYPVNPGLGRLHDRQPAVTRVRRCGWRTARRFTVSAENNRPATSTSSRPR